MAEGGRAAEAAVVTDRALPDPRRQAALLDLAVGSLVSEFVDLRARTAQQNARALGLDAHPGGGDG